MLKKKILFYLFGLILIGLITAPNLSAVPVKFLNQYIEILPLKDVKPGMIFYGKSVLDGSQKIQEFKVEVIAVLNSKASPRIWFRPVAGSNPIIDESGFSQGMSGSPVYFFDENDQTEKLAGAVAFKPLWQPPIPPIKTDVFIQPIEKMLELQGPILSQIQSNSSDPNSTPPAPPLKAGEPIAVVFAKGDISQYGLGTVTLSTSEGFLALGHPMFQSGFSNFPVFKAEIGGVSTNLYSSFKVSSGIIGAQLGRTLIDGFSGVLGIWEAEPKNLMLPVTIDVQKHYLGNYKESGYWKTAITPKNSNSGQLLDLMIHSAIERTSPEYFYTMFDIRVNFNYQDNYGTTKRFSTSQNFLVATGEKIPDYTKTFGYIYELFERTKNELIDIDVYVVAEQTGPNLSIIRLNNVDIKDKTKPFKVEPKEKIHLGLTLMSKNKVWSQEVEFYAPDFLGEIKVKIQDNSTRLQDLVIQSLQNKLEVEDALESIESLGQNKDKLYVEIVFVPPASTRTGTDNQGWQEIDADVEKTTNRKIIEIALPTVQGNFNIYVSQEIIIKIEKPTSN